jgi:hypothetical protein
MRLEGKLLLQKDGQMVINLTGDDFESFCFDEGTKVIVEGDFKTWDEIEAERQNQDR